MAFTLSRLTAAFAVMSLAACSAPAPVEVAAPVQVNFVAETGLPPARWDHKDAGDAWTRATLRALDGPGAPLVDAVPMDATAWCPAFPKADRTQRKAFWVGLLSSLAKHESTWREEVSGGEGRWHGLLQISPATARGYGCAATSAEALKDGPANLSCAVRIMGVTVARDGVISEGGGGVAADWGPFVQEAKREEMRAYTRAQPYCRG
ncbi:MAG: transglycosylase SLT domain-containing protein [Pseudomonadota bacterium]